MSIPLGDPVKPFTQDMQEKREFIADASDQSPGTALACLSAVPILPASGAVLRRLRPSVAAWLTHRPPRLLVAAIGVLALAAGIVVHLERLAAGEQERHLRASLQQVCQWTATIAAERVRDFFGEAVHDSIEGGGHLIYKRYDMERVTANFSAGVQRYPYVDAFFIWSERFSGALERQVIFYPSTRAVTPGFEPLSDAGLPPGSYVTHDTLGSRLFAEAVAHLPTRINWIVTEIDVGGRLYQTALHLLWDDATRDSIFAVVGLMVDLTRVQTGLFHELFESEQFDFLRNGAGALSIAVRDHRGQMIHGSVSGDESPMSSAPVNALFFPDRGTEHRTHITARPPMWTVVTHAAVPPVPPPALRRGLSISVLLLLVITLGCAVVVERQAIRLSRMQTDFVANVTHQLKTPLALVAAASETLTLRRLSTPEKISEYAEIIRSSTHRLTALVYKILDMSRIEGQPQRFVRQTVDLGRLVERAVDDFSKGLTDGVSLRTEIPLEPAVVFVDPAALEQVLFNLLDNAIKYGRQGNVVTVRVEVQAREVVVRVRDRGMGIDSVDLPHVFEKFYRGRDCPTDPPGFGLGLGIVDAIVRAHGGRVNVASQVGLGSEFSVALRSSIG